MCISVYMSFSASLAMNPKCNGSSFGHEEHMKLYRMIKKPPWFFSASTYISNQDNPIQSGPQSRRAVIIPPLLMQYGSMAAKLRSFLFAGNYVLTALTGC